MKIRLRHTSQVSRATAKLCIFFLSFIALQTRGQDVTSPEYRVKAVFLFNFTKFVEWPPSCFQDAAAPFVIAILGDDPFGSFIDQTVAGENVRGHPIVIQRYDSLKDIEHCHLLFIETKQASALREEIAAIQSRVLTVSDSEGFNSTGGMIRLFKKDNKIKLIINQAAVKAAELNISSKLLNVAEIFVASSEAT